MLLIQIIIDLVLIFFVVNLIFKLKKQNIGVVYFVFWLIFWLAAALIINWPQSTSALARILGVGRGADVIIYFSIILIFYFIFYFTLYLRKIEKEITQLVRKVALLDKDKNI